MGSLNRSYPVQMQADRAHWRGSNEVLLFRMHLYATTPLLKLSESIDRRDPQGCVGECR